MTGQVTEATAEQARLAEQRAHLRRAVAHAINSTAYGDHLDDQAGAVVTAIETAGLDEDTIRRDERAQIARRLRAARAELLATSARTEDALGLICHQIEFAAIHRHPEPPAPDEDGLT